VRPATWRSSLAAVALISLAACSTTGAATLESPSPKPSAEPEPAPSLPKVSAYSVAAGEPGPAVKRAAVRFVEALINYDDGGGTPQAARARLAAVGARQALAESAGPLLVRDGAQAGEAIYPQLGGLTTTSASVMTVVRLHRERNGRASSVTRTLDIRLAKTRSRWNVTGIASTGGDRPAARRLEAAAVKVLADSRIILPDSARWDIEAGRVDPRVLRLMLALAGKHTIAVTVLSTGHPLHVYGRRSVSNHRKGRAVDIWAVDGRSVAQQRAGRSNAAKAVAVAALVQGADEVGAPWALSAGRGASFTNTVHLDHLHVGLKR